MKIEQILKQLTPERKKREIEAIQSIKLPPELQKWVKEYIIISARPEFFWKWMYKAVQNVTLSSVSEKHQKSLWTVKTLIIMFVTLLDDIADKSKKGILLNEILKIPFNQNNVKFNNLNFNQQKYLYFIMKIWSYIEKKIKKYPRYKEFKMIFEYDIMQVLNEIKYAYIINKNPYLINKIEYWLYMPYNMQGFVSHTVDFMCSYNFNIKELNLMREISWYAQKMARISNWLATWEREVEENDFTGGVFPYAVENGIFTIDELIQSDSSKIVKMIKNSDIEKKLLREWQQNYFKINELNNQIKTVNIKKVLVGLKKFTILNLMSKGYI